MKMRFCDMAAGQKFILHSGDICTKLADSLIGKNLVMTSGFQVMGFREASFVESFELVREGPKVVRIDNLTINA